MIYLYIYIFFLLDWLCCRCSDKHSHLPKLIFWINCIQWEFEVNENKVSQLKAKGWKSSLRKLNSDLAATSINSVEPWTELV